MAVTRRRVVHKPVDYVEEAVQVPSYARVETPVVSGLQKSFMEKMAPVMALIIVVMAFGLGSMWSKMKYLEKGAGTVGGGVPSGQGGAPAASKYKNFSEAMKDVAKQAGLDGNKLMGCVDKGTKKPVVDADLDEGSKVGVQGTPAFFINGRLLAGAYPFEEFKKVIDEELSGKADKSLARATVSVGSAATQGTKGAPITLIEYSDFQCPFCSRAYPTVKQVLKDYSGKVLFAYKHFPLRQIHPNAQKAGEAAECAREQGKFWEFHDKLFETQADWSGAPQS